MVKLTPGMQQYMNIKNANPDCVILFRMGDFYETFFEDAKLVARELEITLTSRGKGETKAPLAGIPYHAIEPYLAKLVKKGYKVGIVEQTEDPKKAKGLVKRDLVRIVTPGTVIDSGILEKERNNYIISLVPENNKVSISLCDVSTGEFLTTTIEEKKIESEIRRLNPSELIFKQSSINSKFISGLFEQKYNLNELEDRHFENSKANDTLLKHFDVLNLKGFADFEENEISASGALLHYIKETQKNDLPHISNLKKYETADYMFLDTATIRNLELLSNIILKNNDSTLLSILDKTFTPMGKRLIKKWITTPLIKKDQILKRTNSVSELKEKIILRQDISEELKEIYDLERLIGRVAYGNANPKDLVALKYSLEQVPKIKENLDKTSSNYLNELSNLPNLEEARTIIENGIKEEPSITIREGNIIKEDHNSELDELRGLTLDAKTYISELEEKERERTSIKTLKIKYNKVIGYFIDITKPNLHLVPEDYIRKQSQLNSERFVTEELKELETKILTAQERIYELEFDLFNDIVTQLKEYTNKIQKTANNLAVLDCLISLASIAEERGYTKPEFNEEGILEILDSKHPVIEAQEKIEFIPNSCNLTKDVRTMIITGPNMAGKSTYLRQVALISLMAQIGSFVPAKSANLYIVDRIFSRIGAYDDLTNQQSTFMVEMNETANILNNATNNSLIILDEIGRGTSTFDGVSLAWAIAEYLNNKIKAKTLFATHYHHLNNMSELFEGIKNYNISVDENDERIIFLRKIVEGGTDKSYGIQVAKLAGLPQSVINSAKNIMIQIEEDDSVSEIITSNNSINNSIDTESNFEKFKENQEPNEMFEKEEPDKKTIESYELFSKEDEKMEILEEKTIKNQPRSDENERLEKLEDEIDEIKSLIRELTKKSESKSIHEKQKSSQHLQDFF